jgi:hypothetical protein
MLYDVNINVSIFKNKMNIKKRLYKIYFRKYKEKIHFLKLKQTGPSKLNYL